ncbi:tyrosine-type recombinase/integrase [Sphaerochaeta sp. PS]|uniref:tyrosine-type recombinase/integrase n=1 Tax=Sphaerochaeta sp. PS TaxID=3076336 RepID=UPI0028A50522|nr:tyrosine-type recombinase/integrase [Sphaerochaeta sp. PS]MDT4761853.1 tyrosine-type recombinase/integrase [Sphaerochaeta sp. PS]
MRAREPFTLYKRKMGNKIVFYYVVYDESGCRRKFSTGCMTKTQAMAYVMELYRTNSLIPDRKKPAPALTLKEYTLTWWKEGCSYIKAEALRGRVLTQQYIKTNRQLMEKYILPTFGPSPLSEITTNKIENWQRYLLDKKKLAPKSANNILSILSVMMDEARRQNIIPTNPCSEVRTLAKNSKARGILTLEEAKDLLTNLAYWDNPVAYAASLLAACTGMRLGEIRALRPSDIKDGYIHIQHSVDLQGALKDTKTGDSRDLPLPPRLMATLIELCRHVEKCDRVFSIAGIPLSSKTIRNGLYQALIAKGISEKEREKRNITFHSWRHFLNSQLLSQGVNAEKTRKITGHATASMTEHYSHFLVEDFRDVLQVTEGIIVKNTTIEKN